MSFEKSVGKLGRKQPVKPFSVVEIMRGRIEIRAAPPPRPYKNGFKNYMSKVDPWERWRSYCVT